MNIILIGMPGCGKSTVGPLLGKPFYDTDAEIERVEGRAVADIFDSDGEAYFRHIESLTVERLGTLDGTVIATGGGVVKNPANMDSLKHNGFVVFLNRPSSLIDTDNADRPLLRGGRWDTLLNERLPLYRLYADIEIVNDSTPDVCAKRIKEAANLWRYSS